MSKILILYSTVSGNTELVIKKVATLLLDNNCEVELQRVDVANPQNIIQYDVTILASPTYGQGDVEPQFKRFLQEMQKIDLNNQKMAVIGLGDPTYYPEYLTEAAGILEEKVLKAKANLIVPPLRIGMPPIKFIDKLVPRWVEKLLESIK